MATYAIGDIQGCYFAFQALLARIQFNPKRDTLWLVGDIINRGTGSLEVLRWCYQHQLHLKLVLGNHDLHGLAVMHGLRPPHKGDTFQAIIDAPDGVELANWLRHQPLMVTNGEYTMVHAGLMPEWQLNDALAYALEVEQMLQSPGYQSFLRDMYGSLPNAWHHELAGISRLRLITNAMTRMRICTHQGEMEFNFKGELQDIPVGHLPWFDMPNRQTCENRIIFGHWSALGLQQRANVDALDTGCLWGGELTAMCLETREVTQVPSDERDIPASIKH